MSETEPTGPEAEGQGKDLELRSSDSPKTVEDDIAYYVKRSEANAAIAENRAKKGERLRRQEKEQTKINFS